MGLWSRFFQRKEAIGADGTTSQQLREVAPDDAVTWKSALDVSTVLACVRVISNGVSQVPFRLYRDSRNVGATDHPLYRIIYRSPNRWQTSYEFRETMMFHVLMLGNAYAFVNRVGRDRKVREVIPLEPQMVSVKRNDDYSLEYQVTGIDGKQQTFPPDAIWHWRGPSWNSWMGLDAVKAARSAIGLTVALEKGQLDFQKKGAKTSGLMSTKNKIAPEKFEFLAAWLDRHAPGGDRAGKPMILDDDSSYQPFTMSGVDQQLVETRKMQVEEICRHFGVMPIMVGHADKTATYASAEQMFLAHVVHTLAPWYERIEQSADVNLLSEEDQAAGYYTKFTANALMRGAAKDRGEFYAKALGSGGTKGWMTQNDVRALEEMDRIDDPEANKLPQPTNAKPAGTEPGTGGQDGQD
jgi:HK97 family phage portal protein